MIPKTQQNNGSQATLPIDFNFGINRKLNNKQRLGDDTKAWENQTGTVSHLKTHILAGRGYMPGLLKSGSKRQDVNVESFQSIAFDIDSELTLDKALAHPFIQNYCGLLYTSPSHQQRKQKPQSKEWVPPCDRFRLVFVLPVPITDVSLWPYLYEIVSCEFPEADSNCKNVSRYFNGNTDARIILCDETKRLPESIIPEAQQLKEIRQAQEQERQQAKQRQSLNFDPEQTRQLAKQALQYIPQRSPGNDNYHESIRVLMALESEFGDEAIDLAESWSPSISETTWNIPYKIKSIQRTQKTGITIGTLFYIAKQYGFKMPKSTGKGIKSKSFGSPRSEIHQQIDEDDSLSLEDAAEEARAILKQGSDEISQNIALERLRHRCGVNVRVWNNDIIKPLQRETQPDRLKLELKRIKSIEDQIEQKRELSAIAPQFNMSFGALKQTLNRLEVEEQTPKAVSMSLDELLNMESEGMEFLINTWLPKKETLVLAGPPKCGKTLLSTDIAFCVATGEQHFLGEEAKHGKVLIVQSDESPNSCKGKLLKRGFRPQDNDNLEVLLNWDVSQMSVLEKKLESFQPELVIVDSLRRINQGSEISENSAEFADNIYSLKEMFQRYKATGLLIHHTNKDKEAVGVHQLRGTTAIAGAVWGIITLSHIPVKDEESGKMVIKPDDPRRQLELFPRDIEGQSVNIRLNFENHSWALDLTEEQAQAQQKRKTLRQRLWDILENHPQGLSGKQIQELLDGDEPVSNGSVYTTLNRMEDKKLISTTPAPGNQRYTIYYIKS